MCHVMANITKNTDIPQQSSEKASPSVELAVALELQQPKTIHFGCGAYTHCPTFSKTHTLLNRMAYPFRTIAKNVAKQAKTPNVLNQTAYPFRTIYPAL